MFKTLRGRLIFSHTVLILLTLSIAGAGLLLVLRDFRDGVIAVRLNDSIRPASVHAQDLLKRGDTPQQVVDGVQDQVQSSWHVFLLNEQNEVTADSKNQFVGRRFPNNAVPIRRIGPGPITVAGRQVFFAAQLISPPNTPRQVLLLASVDTPFFGGLEELLLPLATAGIIALFVSFLIAIVLARSIAEPLLQLTRASEEIARGNLEHSIPARGDDELGRLAESFNLMARAVQRSQQMQKDFLANVSHELKTPLTSIQGFAQAIAEGATRDLDSARHAAQLIFGESQRMSRLIGDLLTLARLDAGAIPMAQERIALGELLPLWVERFRPRAEEAGAHLSLAIGSLPPIEGDAMQLEQVIANLLDNAIRYNQPGGTITVSAGLANPPAPIPANGSSDGPARWVALRVSDTGPGIPIEHQGRLFERFYRADKARVAGGTGLGLSIAQQIAHAHHGEIQVQSQPGRGSVFTLWLPSIFTSI